jgi:predicted nucleic acid-binding protein
VTAPVFVDTNVFVYARDGRERTKQPRAAQWIERLWRDRCGRTSVQVLTEFYVTVTRKFRTPVPPDEAWEDVASLLAWRPQPADATLLHRAREIERLHRLNWWDAMVVAAAQLQDCALLLTEDLHDGAVFGAVTVRSPFTLGVEEARAAYAPARAASLHRPRGRPRRADLPQKDARPARGG